MKKTIITLWCAIVACAAFAQSSAAPIIRFHTNYYEVMGGSNTFTVYLGSTEDTYVDVDCGFGSVEVEVKQAYFDNETKVTVGTPVTCTVSAAGWVEIYGEADKIDYIDFEGSYITDIDFSACKNVEILNLKHNELRGLDISHMRGLTAAYISDNPFDGTPAVIGADKPGLVILEMAMCGPIDPAFTLTSFPSLVSFSAYSTRSITQIDPSKCPDLVQLTIDATGISSIDVSKNPKLMILNVSETAVTSLDVSQNPLLTELYAQHEALLNQDKKLTSLDVTKNPELQRLYVNGNSLRSIDLSKNTKLRSLGVRRNLLTALNLDGLEQIGLIDVSKNYMTFATIPVPIYADYTYDQYPMPMDRSYAAGTVIDFSDRVLRDEAMTIAEMVVRNRATGEDTPLDETYYTYDNGRVTFLKECEDSVYMSFQCSYFPDITLTTQPFMVKSAADFGQPSAAISMNTGILAKQQAFRVGMRGATAEKPVTIWADFGNGTRVPFNITTSETPDTPNVTGERGGSNTTIYVAEGDDLTAFAVDGVTLYKLDMSGAPLVEHLAATNCRLNSVNLAYNRMLHSLDLSGNALTALSLAAPNAHYVKTMLSDINISDNKLAEIELVDNYGIRRLDVSNNLLAELNLQHGTSMTHVNAAGNRLAEINLQDCESLEELNVADNALTAIAVPEYAPLKKLNVSNNLLGYNTLPVPGAYAQYIYAPQGRVVLPEKAPVVNLAANHLVKDGKTTAYTWHKAADNSVIAATEIKDEAPRFTFTNPDLGAVYCAMEHPLFPDLSGANAIRTTDVTTVAAPSNAVCRFVVAEDGTAILTLAAGKDNTGVYIDPTGNGDLEPLTLNSTYKAWNVAFKAGEKPAIYAYDDDEKITVFSLRNLPLTSFDGTNLKGVKTFNISGAGLTADQIIWPDMSTVGELMIDNNRFSALPAVNPEALYMLTLGNNLFTDLDLSALPNLQTAAAPYNKIATVKFNNPRLWDLNLMGNGIEALSLEGLPGMEQLWLSDNNLSSIDITPCGKLRTLALDANRFTFKDLPRPAPSFYRYEYGNQKPVEAQHVNGKIDLSAHATAHDSDTQYTWYIDAPYINEEGELDGEALFEGDEYSIANGVTTFHKPFQHIMCVMTHPVFPKLYLTTGFFDVTAGVDNILADDTAAPAEYYTLSGHRVSGTPAPGLYIRRQGTRTAKVLIK